MGTRTRLLALVAIGGALAPAAHAATPFTAGTGNGHDLAVGADGTGHLVWMTDETNDRVGYCRIPAGGSACDSESTFLSFPLATTASGAGDHAQVFTPAPNKVVILASCTQCPSSPNRTYRFTSTNNGVDFGAGVEIGTLRLNGQSAYVGPNDVALSVSGRLFQGQSSSSTTTERQAGSTASSVYDAAVARVPSAGDQAVYTVNNLDAVEYRRFDGPSNPPSIFDLSQDANWWPAQFLSGAEGNNDETHLSSGPSGLYLTYRYGQPTENRVALRKFDAGTGTFGSPTYIEGPDPIENSGLAESFHSQDAFGRLHVVWRTLYDGNRLRYTHSDTSGANFTAAANLATRETFFSPQVEAGPDGNGFAAWRSGSTIRVVPIDPQPEPSAGPGPGGGGPDTTPPTAGTPRIADPTLTPGQGTRFTFTSSEAGIATLTVQKQVKGLKVKVRGKRRCVPQTRKRLRALRRQAGSAAAFRRLLRQRRCKAYKKIGSIRQAVVPGQNTIVFSGRIAGRKLRPGRYRALLVIRDTAGNLSRVERVNFRVFRPRRR
jgi:hypothetical protein